MQSPTELQTWLSTKTLKAKEKSWHLEVLLREGSLNATTLLESLHTAPDALKAIAVEALEAFTRTHADGLSEDAVLMLLDMPASAHPRLKLESARVLANVAAMHAPHMDAALPALLENALDPGTVTRWSAATALCAIVRARSDMQQEWIVRLDRLQQQESQESIRKIYLKTLKALAKPKRL
jgi:hypothetical protein